MDIFIYIAIGIGIIIWLITGLFGRWMIMEFALGLHSFGDTTFFCGGCDCEDAAEKYSIPFIFLGPISIILGIITLILTGILRLFLRGERCIIGERIKGTLCYEIRQKKYS